MSIGWDVRGWRGKNQATAVVSLDLQSCQLEWVGISKPFQFLASSTSPGFIELVEPAVGKMRAKELRYNTPVVIAIDAPLAFPRTFRKLINGTVSDVPVTKTEIDNPLAYRSCERRVSECHSKKPLSAPFDKLGNNATLAIMVANKLSADGFHVVPQETWASERSVIEVYPALVKVGMHSLSPAIPVLHNFLPSDVQVGTDQYDASICALLGILYGGGGQSLGLPALESFPDEFPDFDEGWIFSLSSTYVEEFRYETL